MKKKLQLKYVFWAVVIVVVAFIVWEILKAIQSTIQSTEKTANDIAAIPGNIVMAPFTALSSAWSAIKSFFTPGASPAQVDAPLPPTSPFDTSTSGLWGYLNQT